MSKVQVMISMTAFRRGASWYVNVLVRGSGMFVVIRKTRHQAWRDAWKQVASLFEIMNVEGNC